MESILALVVASMMGVSFNPPSLTVPIVEAAPLEASDYQNIALVDAQTYKLSPDIVNRMMATINCESQWSATSTSATDDVGLAQIHLSDWGISTSTAEDPYYALDFIAKEFAAGEKERRYWTCYRDLYENAPLIKV